MILSKKVEGTLPLPNLSIFATRSPLHRRYMNITCPHTCTCTHASYCPSLPPSPVSVPCSLLLLPPPSIHCPCNSRRCPDAPLPYPQYVPPPAQPRLVSNSWLRLSVGPHSTRLCTYLASLIFRSPSPALGFWILRLRCRLRLVSCGLSYAR